MNTEINKLSRKECIKFVRENYKTKTIEEIAVILGRKNHYVKTIMDKSRLKPKKSPYICNPKPKVKLKPKAKPKVKLKVKKRKNKELTKEQKKYIHKHWKEKPIIYIAQDIGSYPLKVTKYYRLNNIPIIFERKRGYKNKETEVDNYNLTQREITMIERNRKLKERKKDARKKLLQEKNTLNFKSELEKNLYEINKSNNEGYEFGK